MRSRERMRRANRELPRVLDGAYRYTDPWFRSFIRRIFVEGLGLPERDLGELTDELFACFEDPGTFRVAEGARELLAELRALGLTTGVISNWSARLPRLLAALGLKEALDPILCSALEGIEKPEAGIFLAALRRVGVEPAAALHAGDDPRLDVAAARAVGMQAVHVDHGGSAVDEAERGGRVTSVAELRSVILERV